MIEVNSTQRVDDHFVETIGMVEIGTMPENLPSAESIKKLKSKRQKIPKALKHSPDETDITRDS